MFDELTEKFDLIFKKIRGQGKITEANIKDALRDIRRTLLEADVNFKVAKRFIKNVETKALGIAVLSSISPGQMIVKIIHDELIELLGGKAIEFQIKGSPEVIMVCGLQGSGKTTTVAKLAYYLDKNGRKPLVSSVDIHRPAAIEQLRILAEKNSLHIYCSDENTSPLEIAKGSLDALSGQDADILIMDTAGRNHIDDDMMKELSMVAEVLNPRHVLFVADGMTGQDAVNAVTGFLQYIEFDGVILTKMDGDARGGAALSIREVTGKPVLFVGTGESIDSFEVFHPDRFASRILGMGDIVSLVEKAQEVIDEKKVQSLQKKLNNDGLTLEDFLDQIRQIKMMGPLDQLLGMIPGMRKMMKGIDVTGNEFKHIESIILSMTIAERENPSIIDGSRRRRIAHGSGTSLHDVNNLLKQFKATKKMIKKMSKIGGKLNAQNFEIPL